MIFKKSTFVNNMGQINPNRFLLTQEKTDKICSQTSDFIFGIKFDDIYIPLPDEEIENKTIFFIYEKTYLFISNEALCSLFKKIFQFILNISFTVISFSLFSILF